MGSSKPLKTGTLGVQVPHMVVLQKGRSTSRSIQTFFPSDVRLPVKGARGKTGLKDDASRLISVSHEPQFPHRCTGGG